MEIVLITLCSMIFVFSMAIIVFSWLFRDKMETEKRVKQVVGEKKNEPEVVRKKKIKKKPQKQKFSRTRKELEQIEDELYNVGIRIQVQTFIVIWIGITIAIPLLFLLIGLKSYVCVAAALVCAFGPILMVKIRKKQRKTKLESQLVDSITTMQNALKAGYSFQTALKNISTEMEAPISEEFGRVFRETQRGMTIEDSLDRMTERTNCEDLEILCTAIAIQRKIGGNLAEVLEKISDTIQNRIDIRHEIKTRTASGRVSGYIVGALPFILLVIVSVMNPDYASTLFQTTPGHIMLGVSAVMEVIGFIVIKKIVSVKY